MSADRASEKRPQIQPSDEELEDLLFCCRYGEIDEVRAFVEKYGVEFAANTRDHRGNTILHMVAANGHAGERDMCVLLMIWLTRNLSTDILEYLLPQIPTSLLSVANKSGDSTPLHWASLNSHLPIVKALVAAGGPSLIDAKDSSGCTPLGEAERSGWDEGAAYLVSAMNLNEGEMKAKETDEAVDENQTVEVEIEDADGGVAKMTIGGPPDKLPAADGAPEESCNDA